MLPAIGAKMHSYPGGYSRVKDFIRAWNDGEGLTTTAAFVPLVFELGEAFQFDWSEEGLTVGGVYYRVQVAHMSDRFPECVRPTATGRQQQLAGVGSSGSGC